MVDKMEGIVYLNCIVHDISLNPFKDEGKQESKEEVKQRFKHHFMGDSSKQLNMCPSKSIPRVIASGSMMLCCCKFIALSLSIVTLSSFLSH